MAEDKCASDDHGPVPNLNDPLLHQADLEDVPEHLRVLARRLEVALAPQKSNLHCDD